VSKVGRTVACLAASWVANWAARKAVPTAAATVEQRVGLWAAGMVGC